MRWLLAAASCLATVLVVERADAQAAPAEGSTAPAASAGGTVAARSGPPASPAHHTESRAHVLGLHYDQGKTSAFGASYLHTWEYGTSYGGLGGDFWEGLGIDGRLVTHGFQRIDGGLTYAVGRISGVGDAGGFGLELAAGAAYGTSTAPVPAAAPGIFFGLYYVELGYSYQFPFPGFARPDWLSSHQFSLRIHIPVHRYAKREWDTER